MENAPHVCHTRGVLDVVHDESIFSRRHVHATCGKEGTCMPPVGPAGGRDYGGDAELEHGVGGRVVKGAVGDGSW